MVKNKISFCTVCMNRVEHLKETLPVNIQNNKDAEFVILDYNSSDGLEDYIKQNMHAEIARGTVVYYRTFKPKHFDRSHSRNLAFRLANGNIVCNIDADNFTGENFSSFIDDKFTNKQNIFLTTISARVKYSPDVKGRICVRKDDFLKVKGFDERMQNYGFEDSDFANRLKASGIKPELIPQNKGFLTSIFHEPFYRINNEYLLKNLKTFLINYISPAESEFILLLKKNQFSRFTLIDYFTYDVLNSIHVQDGRGHAIINSCQGKYRFEDDKLILTTPDNSTTILHPQRKKNRIISYINDECAKYYKVSDKNLITDGIFRFSQLMNRTIMLENSQRNTIIANHASFGYGTVYKNFNYNSPIVIK